jgi:hypothetical protein
MYRITPSREELQDELLVTSRQRDRALNQLEQAKGQIENILYRLNNAAEPDADGFDDTPQQKLTKLRAELGHVIVISEELHAKQAQITQEIDDLERELDDANEDEDDAA